MLETSLVVDGTASAVDGVADGVSTLGASAVFAVSAGVIGCATVVVGATCVASVVAGASGFPADPLSPDEFPPLLVVGSD